MNILVCVKQILSHPPESGVQQSLVMNRFDEYAVEEALQIKESFTHAEPVGSIEPCWVTVVTYGPDSAGEVVKRALGMGVDHGIHVVSPFDEESSAFATAARLASLVLNQKILPDLILTGILSQDRMAGLVGSMLAETLGWPAAIGVVQISTVSGSRAVTVQRELDGGLREKLEITLPALLSVQAGINAPRYPSLSHMLKAARKGFTTVCSTTLPKIEEREESLGLTDPEKTREGIFLEGSIQEKAEGFMTFMGEKGVA